MVRRIKQPPRRAFVLGAGGVLGFAWTVGALTALKDELGVEVGDGDLLIGTSAGSVMAAILACGGDVDLIRRQQMGMPLPDDPPIHWRDEDSGGNTPPRPGLRPGSPRLLLGGIRHRSVPPIVALSGLLPRGRGSIDAVRGVIRTIAEERLDNPAEWPARQAWLVAVDYKTGRRVVFGREGSPAAALPDAVGASCAIPAWYQPVHINGVAYVDGGMYSNTSTDLTIGQGFDEVYVLAPMGAVRFDTPRSPVAMIERRVRKAITRGIQADLVKLRAEGVRTTFLAPGPADLDVMGMNLMNARRRIAVLHTSIHTTTNYLRGGDGTSGTQLRAVSG